MPKFLIKGSYTAEGLKGLKKDKASGREKAVATACTEVVPRLRRPPSILHDDPTQNYLRFRINPSCEIAIGLSVMDAEGTGSGEKVELLASRFDAGHEREAYERVLSDALMGDFKSMPSKCAEVLRV